MKSPASRSGDLSANDKDESERTGERDAKHAHYLPDFDAVDHHAVARLRPICPATACADASESNTAMEVPFPFGSATR